MSVTSVFLVGLQLSHILAYTASFGNWGDSVQETPFIFGPAEENFLNNETMLLNTAVVARCLQFARELVQ